MFVLRLLHGDNKGFYYSGADDNGKVSWTESLDKAKRYNACDTAGGIMALIDIYCLAAVPERLPDTTDAECGEFAKTIAEGMFQNPSEGMVDLILKRTIRKSPDDPLNEPENIPERSDPYYMSVWEWLGRAITK